MSGASRGAGGARGRRKEGDDRWPRAGSDRVATVTRGHWATGSTTDAWARARGDRSEARATCGVGLAGLARLAVGRRGASRGMLLRACAELQGPGVRRGVREGQAAAWAGGTRLERPRRGSAEADRAGPRVWAVGLVTGPSWVGLGFSWVLGFLSFSSPF